MDSSPLPLGQRGRRSALGSGAGTTRDTARGERRPALAFPSPSFPPSRGPCSRSPSSLLLLPHPSSGGRRGGGQGRGRGAGRAALPRFGPRRPKPSAKQPRGRARARAAPPAPSPPCPCRRGWDPTKSQTLNDRGAGGAGEDRDARAQPGHCRFKLTCPLFGIEPMRERPLPGPSQWRGGEGGRAPPTHLY